MSRRVDEAAPAPRASFPRRGESTDIAPCRAVRHRRTAGKTRRRREDARRLRRCRIVGCVLRTASSLSHIKPRTVPGAIHSLFFGFIVPWTAADRRRKPIVASMIFAVSCSVESLFWTGRSRFLASWLKSLFEVTLVARSSSPSSRVLQDRIASAVSTNSLSVMRCRGLPRRR